MSDYIIPAGYGEAEYIDKKSRFIGQVQHAESEAEAMAFVEQIRKKHADATHNVWAYVLNSGAMRWSDDGEPGGTSGQPTLNVFRSAGVVDVCCVVTRYFGGTLLGPGGLVRAYTAAAQEAVADAHERGGIVEMTLVTEVVVQLPYALYDRVGRLASDAGGKVKDQLFLEDVQITLVFRAGEEAPFIDAVRELACGEDLCRAGEPRFAEF